MNYSFSLICQAGTGILLSNKEVLKYLLDGTVKSVPEGFFDEEKDSGKDLDSSVSHLSMLSRFYAYL